MVWRKNAFLYVHVFIIFHLSVYMFKGCQRRNKVEIFHTRFQQNSGIWLHRDGTAKQLNAEGSPRYFIADTGWGHPATTDRLWMRLRRDVLSCPLGGFLSASGSQRNSLAAEDAAQYWSYTALNMSQYQWWEHAAYPAELLLEGCFNHETAWCWSYNSRQGISDETMLHIKSPAFPSSTFTLRHFLPGCLALLVSAAV